MSDAADVTDVTDATVAGLAAVGPFFAVATHRRAAAVAPWRPMSELVDDPAVLAHRVAAVRERLAANGRQPLAAVGTRVAASVTQLGLTSRLLSPSLAAAALYGIHPHPALDAVHWQPEFGGAFPLSLPRVELLPAGPPGPDQDAAWARALLAGPIRQLVDVTRAFSVSPKVLWGNVASAVNGAATVLAAAAPGHAERARAVAGLLLRQPELRDAHGTAAGGTRFRRRSCCLIYRSAPRRAGALCGDCVLSGG